MTVWVVCCCELMKCLIDPFELCCWPIARENSGEHWFSRPSDYVSPRRD